MNKKILLSEKEIPEKYLNINYYLQKHLGKLPDPPLNPATKKPAGVQDLSGIFPMELIKEEGTGEEYVAIPEEVYEKYKIFRPSPVFRASGLEEALKTPAHLYYKFEGGNPVGSHKLNTALMQAYINKKEGTEILITETGAGQWGSALSLSCRLFDLKTKVFMVRISFEQKPYRKTVMMIYGAEIVSSPSKMSEIGRKILNEKADHPGSLGIAISEALSEVIRTRKAKYALGSVLNHVLLHQTIIGLEAKKQMEMAGEYPDCVIACCGGGSNFAGIAFPFLADKLKGRHKKTRFIAAEPASCASLTRGKYRYDFGDSAGMTPLLKMKTLGSDFVPSPIHAGGLRYHGVAPLVAFLHNEGLIEAKAYGQKEIFDSAITFARSEGYIPAPESAHAIKCAIDEALTAKKEGKKKIILFNLSGHGLLDLKGYQDYLEGKLL